MRRYVDYLTSQARDGSLVSPFGDWYDWGHPYKRGPSLVDVSRGDRHGGLGARCPTPSRGRPRSSVDPTTPRPTRRSMRPSRRDSSVVSTTPRRRPSATAARAKVPTASRSRRTWCPTRIGGAVVASHRRRPRAARLAADRRRGDAGLPHPRPRRGRPRRRLAPRLSPGANLGSYGYLVDQGFTTLPESWDAVPGSAHSLNHLMFGHLVEWHYAYVAGIRQQPGSVGWRKVLIAPDPGPLDERRGLVRQPGRPHRRRLAPGRRWFHDDRRDPSGRRGCRRTAKRRGAQPAAGYHARCRGPAPLSTPRRWRSRSPGRPCPSRSRRGR